MNAGFKIKRRDDLTPGCVALQFRIANSVNGQQTISIVNDIAAWLYGSGSTYSAIPGTGGDDTGAFYEGIGTTGRLLTAATFTLGDPFTGGTGAYIGGSAGSALMLALQNAALDFSAVGDTVDMEGYKESVTTCTIVTVPVDPSIFTAPSVGGGGTNFWAVLFPELANLNSAAIANNVTVVDDGGSPIDTSVFQYLLTRGQVAPWMLLGNTATGAPAQSAKATVTATFSGTETVPVGSGTPTNVTTGHAQNVPKHATCTLLTIPGGTYINQSALAGEVVPYGLAGYIYNIESVVQYEGSFTIQETEITDLCPLGNNLNISGGLEEWATMATTVQQISYDLTAGRTTLTFGPAPHLGEKDFVERLRVNRSPIRSYYGIGGNVTNNPGANGGATLGQDVSVLGPAQAAAGRDLQIHPISLTDLAANAGAYTSAGFGVPGITHDTRPSGQPNYGGISDVSAPGAGSVTQMLAEGSGGSLGRLIRLSTADLPDGAQMFIQPISGCDDDGSPVTIYLPCFIVYDI